MNNSNLYAGLLIALSAASPIMAEECHSTPGWEAMETAEIRLMAGDVVQSRIVRIADDASERAAGYQWICAEQALGTAVLFVFPKMLPSAFHMRSVYVPLDIHFFDERGVQVDAMVMQPEPPGHPGRSRYYQSAGSFRYALEIARPVEDDLQSTPAPKRLLIESLP